MGFSSSKPIVPNNPLQEIQMKEVRRKTDNRKKEKQREKERKQQEKRRIKKIKKLKKNSKLNKNGVRISKQIQRDNYKTPPQLELSKNTFDQKVDAKLRKQIEDTFCTFIINQLSLTIQFFGNFDNERKFAQTRILEKENGFNQKLEEHSIILPNALDKGVESRVQYMPKYGPGKFDIVPLHTQTMYVIFENIDIAKPNDANYDSISPICKVDMETDFSQTLQIKGYDPDTLKTHKWKGYVRLKLRVNPIEITETDDHLNPLDFGRCSEMGTQKSSIYISAVNQGLADETRNQDEARSSNSSAYISESDYDYAYITQLNTHHPLAELTMSNLRERIMVDIKVLPESCISHLHSFIGAKITHDEDEDAEYSDEEGYGSSALERYNNNIQYLNSKSFMCYFADLLQQKLANDLDLDESEFDEATYRGSSIHTKHYEIIPAVHVAYNAQVWPDCAFQFKRRERPVSTNPLTGQKFQWPTQSMIRRIESFGYHVIPIGYAPKVRKNPYRELEWKIVFPKAERYLEANLTSTQVKVLMISKALVKTFIEPQQFDNTIMFTIDHLRTHLFWECERDFCAWPEEFLGEVLVKFLKSFRNRLRKTFLSDFFIQERNLFESIPESSLSRLSNIISEIIANPTMHILMAYRNLHQWEDFFPKINYKKIYSCLVDNNYLKLKALSNNSKTFAINENGDNEIYSKTTIEDGVKVQGLIGYAQEREKSRGLSRRTLQLKQKELMRKLELEKRKQSVDSINLEFVFNQTMSPNEKKKDFNYGVENLRRTNVLETFIEQFIIMAENSLPIRSIHQAKIYLNQAKRLCSIYSDYGCDINAIEFISRVEMIEKEIEILRITGNDIPPPALPIRTSLEPVKSFQQKEKPKKLQNVAEVNEIERRPSIVRFSNENVSSEIVVEAQIHTSKSPKFKNKSTNGILKSASKSSDNEIEPWNFDENTESTSTSSGKFDIINNNKSETVKTPETKVHLKSTLRSIKERVRSPTTVLKFDFTKTESAPQTVKSPKKKELVKSKLQSKSHQEHDSANKILKNNHKVIIEPTPEVIVVSKGRNFTVSNNKPKKVTIVDIKDLETKNESDEETKKESITEELDTFEKRKAAVHRMIRDTLLLRLPGSDTTKL